MNQRQLDVIKYQYKHEQGVLRNLKKIYADALDEINNNIASLMGRTDTENLQSIIYQVQYQEALKTQINAILDNLNTKQFTSISEYLTESYENGFIGTMYDLQGQDIPLIFPIDQNQVVKVITEDSKLSKSLYESLGYDINNLKYKVKNEISRGIASASSYADIARNIKRQTDISLNKAYRIARTEGHRIQNEAANDALYKAKDKGADIVKQWDATLDGRTRPSHRMVDGEIRELNEKFSNGLRFPGDPHGKAAEVINCRCALLQRAKWALDEDELKTLQDRAKFFGLMADDSKEFGHDKAIEFSKFKKKYLDITGNDGYNGNESTTTPKSKIKNVVSNSKQFGKKLGRHALDFELDPSNPDDRIKFENIINSIVDNADEVRIGNWRGQEKEVLFHIRNKDVVITDQNNEFITILKDGVTNERVKNARRK